MHRTKNVSEILLALPPTANVLMMEAVVYIDVVSVISLDKYDFEQSDQHPLLSVPRNRTQSKPFQTKIWFEIWMKAAMAHTLNASL